MRLTLVERGPLVAQEEHGALVDAFQVGESRRERCKRGVMCVLDVCDASVPDHPYR